MASFAYRRAAAYASHIRPNNVRAFSTAGSKIGDNDVLILATARTPMGGFHGALSGLTATQLGSHVIKAVAERAGVKDSPDEVIMGNVLSANLGQAPARQAAIGAGLPEDVVCTTVNKVCSSGLKAVMIGANEIRLGQADRVIAGGMESMSQVPYYSPNMRTGAKYGDVSIIDGLAKDGLTDAYGKFPMGNCGEVCAAEMKITRADQDAYAEQSYRRAQAATESGKFKEEIAPVVIPGKKGNVTVDKDEEAYKADFSKFPTLRPAFKHPTDPSFTPTVTAANASVLSDGAAAVYLVSGKYAKANGLESKAIARVLGYADAEQAPVWFTTSPTKAITKALEKAQVDKSKVDLYEINEAFSCVAIANSKLLSLDPKTVNVYGGAVSLGHPLGASGARILCTLVSALKQENTANGIGVAAICNGGGGASAVVVELLNKSN